MRARLLLAGLVGTALAAAGAAQFDGISPGGSSSSYEVAGVTVDVAGKTPDEARYGGWRLAQRKAWVQLSKRLGAGGAPLGDGTLDQLVSGVVIESEQIGPTRYIARLGILFDRARTSALLGIADLSRRSSPMLVVPVQQSGGVAQVFEQRTDWQEAWSRFRTGNSAVDYVRLGGTGPDPLLLSQGQVERRGRGWWRAILDQYGASDILIPVVRLTRQWPGGPVIGTFEARHGPDNELLEGFSLRVGSSDGVPALLDAGVKRMDAIYARAMTLGVLVRDPALSPPPQPVAVPTDDVGDLIEDLGTTDLPAVAGQGITVTVQYDSPSASSVANIESTLRGIDGVRSASTTSLALGGVSLMRVVFDGDPATLRAGLESRGYQVVGAGSTLRIRRAPQLQLPDLPADDRPTG
ncbi:heavy-metal-associated domain-containing protein [Sphingomonas sp.]|uniref:heavy-metal-associated domain-containing protein n=1 Tax=Sphingomonas sp. TaxID=28214 RepID=UPI003B004637